MQKPLLIENTIVINAPAKKVWEALTNPELTKKYMFGCEAVSDWKIGSSLTWKGIYEGKEMIFVKGTVEGLKAEKFLAYTVFDPLSSLEDIPKNYLTVTYDLSFANGETTLTVTQGDYASVAEGERRYADSYNGGKGWNPILVEIKKLVEEPA